MASFTLAAVKHTAAQTKEKYALQEANAHRIWFIIAAVVGTCTVANWTSKAIAYLSSSHGSATDAEGNGSSPPRKSSLRRVPSAIAAALRVLAFRLWLPTGFGVVLFSEMAFITAYITATFCLLYVDSDHLSVWFFEDRAAQMAVIQLPFIVALAGKNNVISFLTGISHEKLNILHRAAARTFLILIWTHFLSRYTQGLYPGSWEEHFIRMGAMALGAFTMATVLSLKPIRHFAYEFFLVAHIALILIALVGAYYHTSQPELQYMVWPAFVVWGFDRFLRAARLLVNNTIWKGTAAKHSHGTVELVSDDTLRLTLMRPVSWTAGQHAYVLLPSVSQLPTEAHPFTISTISGALDGSDGPKEKELTFLIRTRSGFTKRMKAQAQSGRFSVPAYMDGPYGQPPDLSNFSTCVLVAGGSGVSYTLPLLLNLVHLSNAGKTSVRRIVFVWAIRSQGHTAWVQPSLDAALAAAPRHLVIELKLHVTSGQVSDTVPVVTGAGKSSSSVDTPVSAGGDFLNEKDSQVLATPIASAPVLIGRPDLPTILRNEIDHALGPVSVDVCGPHALSNTVRSALRSEGGLGVLKGRAPVTLHVETFGM